MRRDIDFQIRAVAGRTVAGGRQVLFGPGRALRVVVHRAGGLRIRCPVPGYGQQLRLPVRMWAWCAVFGLILFGASGVARGQGWTFHGPVVEGGQFDVVRGPNDRLHIVSTRYYQLDAGGNVLLEEPVGDEQQCGLCFPPAIAVGDDGTVHVVTRHGGDWNSGHDIRYRRRAADGTWDRDYLVGGRVKRNYVVGVAWAGPGQVFVQTSQAGDNVWGDLHVWRAESGGAVLQGSLSGIWRADCDARMRGVAGHLFLVSGKPDGGGQAAYFSHANPGGSVASELSANLQTHVALSYRTGFPDLYVDRAGYVHFSFGAQHAVFYNKYGVAGGKAFPSDRQIFDSLGVWHLEAGLSAVAASDDGRIVVAVALRSDGSQSASNSDLLWNLSLDGGDTWSAPQDTGRNTDGGEGRRRPRLVAVGRTFYLFYRDNADGRIHLATMTVPLDADQDGHSPPEDCDDGDPDVHPGAEEVCNGVDDDCDGSTDEGCGTPDAGREDATGEDGGTGREGGPVGDAGGDVGRTEDGGASEGPGHSVTGGCGCRAGVERGSFGSALLWLACVGTWWRRRRSGRRSWRRWPGGAGFRRA